MERSSLSQAHAAIKAGTLENTVIVAAVSRET
jgi:hypothetical protein